MWYDFYMNTDTCPIITDGVRCINKRRSKNTICQSHYDQKRKTGDYRILRQRIDRRPEYCPIHPTVKHVPERTYRVCRMCQRITRYAKMYGITAEQYQALLDKQQYTCAFDGCDVRFDDEVVRSGEIKAEHNVQSLFIDHDHTTNEVRGLLCREHNFLLGLAKDSIGTLNAAIRYLEDFNNGKLA